MLGDNEPTTGDNNDAAVSAAPDPDTNSETAPAPVKKTAAKKASASTGTTKKAAAKKSASTSAGTTKKATAKRASGSASAAKKASAAAVADPEIDLFSTPATTSATPKVTTTTRTRRTTKTVAAPPADSGSEASAKADSTGDSGGASATAPAEAGTPFVAPIFQAPAVTTTTRSARKRPAKQAASSDQSADTGTALRDRSSDDSSEGSSESWDPGADTGEDQAEPAHKKSGNKSGNRSANKSANRSGGGSDRAGSKGETDESKPDSADEAKSDSTPAAGSTEGSDGRAGDSGDQGRPDESDDDGEGGGGQRRRRRRGGRRRRKSSDGGDQSQDGSTDGQNDSGSNDNESKDSSDPGSQTKRGAGNAAADNSSDSGGTEKSGKSGNESAHDSAEDDGSDSAGSRRRRRRRRQGDNGDGTDNGNDDPANTVTRVRKGRSAEDEITAVSGSTRLEAKKQRRREGREAGRRRAPIVSEAEFLARREAVNRVMAIRQREDLTQIAVLEDKVLVEHYVARESQTSMIGNVYIGRVQNVLPSMEAAFIDIGKGRNAVLYAGEVNWSALGHKEGQPRKIESVLSSGQAVLVQVTKDPIGHKGARLTCQVSLAGRFLVYVPDGTTSGISRKLPDTERNRLKTLLKEIVPDTAGVIVRTAAEGASEEELTRDVERLKARWEDIEKGTKKSSSAPKLLYGEPDLTLKVVRDLFTEDFSSLVIQGDGAWDTVRDYVAHVAPDLEGRLERFEPSEGKNDLFASYRVDEQIAKGLDRKVWLPSGGSLVIDRTEAMTVVDVNTGKFTGSGGNLEETVTKNNLEAAEEIVRQLRLRDIGGIIVVDFIDMVLESNRDLVLRRMVECLGRDRTRHQVAEVTSLGLVQMTRKRIGTGLLEAFSENCEHCDGRGLVPHDMPVESKDSDDDNRRGRRGRGRQSGNANGGGNSGNNNGGGNNGGGKNGHAGESPTVKQPTPAEFAAMAGSETSETSPAEDASVAATVSGETSGENKQEAPDTSAKDTSAPSDQRAKKGKPVKSGKSSKNGKSDKPGKTGNSAESAKSGTADKSDNSGGFDRSDRAGDLSEQAVDSTTPAAPETEPDNASESEAAALTSPAAPVVVTSTRRRSSRRPAGPPTPAGPDSVGPDSAVPDSAESVPTMAEVDAPSGAGQPAVHGLVEPGVVDREPGHAESDAVPDSEAGSDSEGENGELHVPVKKKSGRRR